MIESALTLQIWHILQKDWPRVRYEFCAIFLKVSEENLNPQIELLVSLKILPKMFNVH